MNEEIVTKKLLALLTARSRVSHQYHWAPVLVLWSLGWLIMGILDLFGVLSFWSFVLVLPVQLLMLRFGPWAHEEARSAKLEGLWTLAWVLQCTVQVLMPFAKILSTTAGHGLALVFLGGSILLTGLLKQRRPLMIVSLLTWLGLPLLWVLVPETLRQAALSFMGALTCFISAFVSRTKTPTKA